MAAPIEPERRDAPITATERGRKIASRPLGAGGSLVDTPAGRAVGAVGAVMAVTPWTRAGCGHRESVGMAGRAAGSQAQAATQLQWCHSCRQYTAQPVRPRI